MRVLGSGEDFGKARSEKAFRRVFNAYAETYTNREWELFFAMTSIDTTDWILERMWKMKSRPLSKKQEFL
jgi:hypothetical protein